MENTMMKMNKILFVSLLILTADIFAQSTNPMDYDATTNNKFYIGTDSSARLGVGIDQAKAISRMLTIKDSGNVGSQTFIPGWMTGFGWGIDADTSKRYTLTIDNLTIRGTLSVYELLLNQIRATNGNLLVTSAGTVDSVAKNKSSFWVTDVTEKNLSPFTTGDIILSQGTSMSGLTWDSTGNIVNNSYLIKRLIFVVDSTSGRKVYVSNAPGAPTQKNSISKGDVFCRIGNKTDANRMGFIGLFADDQYSPYLRISDSVTSWAKYSDPKSVRTQLGKLTGIFDQDFGGRLEGYGLYSNNAYIKGKIIVTNPADFHIEMKWDSIANKPAYFNGPSGKGLFISATNMGYYNSSDYPSSPWRTYMDATGKFYLTGKGSDYLSWNDSVLTIKGAITLTNTIAVDKITGLGGLAYLSSIGLDNVTDGSIYARVLKTDISSGHIKLSESVGTIDDIKNGTYAKVLSTEIDAGHIKITGSDGTTTVISGGKIQAGTIKGSEIAAGTILTSNLSFTPVQNTNVVAMINASAEGLQITGNKIKIDGTVIFGSGYDPTTKTSSSDVTTIIGNTINTGYINALNVTANSVKSTWVYAGNIGAGQISTGTLDAARIAVGTITSDKLSVNNLSAISANMGTITAGTMDIGNGAFVVTSNGALTATSANIIGTISSSTNNQRATLYGSGITFYDENGSAHTSMYSAGSYHSSFYINGGYSVIASAASTINLSAGVNPSTLSIQSGLLMFDGNNVLTSNSSLNATNLLSGTVPSARLGTGTANNSTFLRGDGTWNVISASSPSTTTLYVASTSGGSATTQLKIRTLNINGTNFSVLVTP
jgi:hypothetical protein